MTVLGAAGGLFAGFVVGDVVRVDEGDRNDAVGGRLCHRAVEVAEGLDEIIARFELAGGLDLGGTDTGFQFTLGGEKDGEDCGGGDCDGAHCGSSCVTRGSDHNELFFETDFLLLL